MHGVAYTVFEGIKPEPMDVEVFGVLQNMNGPKGNIILVRLHGQKVEYTGVVAGMSGSPVYLDGKLAGAIAFRIGEFSKEPIAGVTPIADMLEINAMDKLRRKAAASQGSNRERRDKPSGPGVREAFAGSVQNFAQVSEAHRNSAGVQRIHRRRCHQFAPQFASAGIVPVMGADRSATTNSRSHSSRDLLSARSWCAATWTSQPPAR